MLCGEGLAGTLALAPALLSAGALVIFAPLWSDPDEEHAPPEVATSKRSASEHLLAANFRFQEFMVVCV